MKDLTELYVACGAEVNEEGFIKLPAYFKPIDILVKVLPEGISLESDESTSVTLTILIPDKLMATDRGVIQHTEYQPLEIVLPIEAIELGGRLEVRAENKD